MTEDKEWQKQEIRNLQMEIAAREKDLDSEKKLNAMYDEVVAGEQSKYAKLKAEYFELEYDHRFLVAELNTAHLNLKALERRIMYGNSSSSSKSKQFDRPKRQPNQCVNRPAGLLRPTRSPKTS